MKNLKEIGLTKAQIIEILSEEIAYGKVSDAEKLKEVIARVIDENNKKLLEDIKKLFRLNH